MNRMLHTFIIMTASLLFLSACEPEESGPWPTGSEIGEKCFLQYCSEEFCTKDNHGDCQSLLCVGRPNAYYCTEYCNFPGDCPAGYRCSIGCDYSLAENDFCIKIEDYEYLKSIDKCP